MNGRVIYRRLLGFVVPYWKVFIFALLTMIVFAATDTAFAAFMKPLLDGGLVNKDPAVIRWLPLALIGIFLVRGIFGFSYNYSMVWISRKVIMDLRQAMFQRVLFLPVHYYDHISAGELISKFSYDVEQVAQASSNSITVIVRDTFTVIGLVAWMFYLNWQMTCVFLLLGPAVALLFVTISKRLRRYSVRIQTSMSDVSRAVDEVVKGQEVVKTYGGQQLELARFTEINKANRQFNMKMTATLAVSVQLMQFLGACALAAIIFVATLDSVLESVSVGVFISFMTAMLLLMPPIKNLTTVNAALQRGIAAAASLFELLDKEIERDSGQHRTARAQGQLEFRQVSFAYDLHKGKVLDQFNLVIKPGQTVALVGRSGSGKSTLVKLLTRLYDIRDGEICLDGVNILNYPLENLRAQIAYVGQDVVLFNGSVASNIAYGQAHTSEQAILQAAKAAHAMEFIERLQNGLHTTIGANGVLLSGGQRQRLAIARALLKNAPLLILDEATSALDNESEHWVQAGLNRLMIGRTTLVIAHRLSTVEEADLIVLMDSGRILDSGKHQELLNRSNYYTSLHNRQFSDRHELA